MPRNKIPEEDLIAELQRLADELGHPPGVEEMNKLGNYTHMTYVRRYGTWNAAVEAAGLEPNTQGQGGWPAEELLGEIRRLAQELGRPPLGREMDEYGKFSRMTYTNRFESWVSARDKALSEEVLD